jgi:hypothetical protein
MKTPVLIIGLPCRLQQSKSSGSAKHFVVRRRQTRTFARAVQRFRPRLAREPRRSRARRCGWARVHHIEGVAGKALHISYGGLELDVLVDDILTTAPLMVPDPTARATASSTSARKQRGAEDIELRHECSTRRYSRYDCRQGSMGNSS